MDSYTMGYSKQNDSWDSCPMCKGRLRPDIVFFYERAPFYEDLLLELNDCEMFVAIGTSGAVLNMDLMLNDNMKYTILNNLEPSDAINHEKFTKALFKPATQAIDEIVVDIESFLNTKDKYGRNKKLYKRIRCHTNYSWCWYGRG